MIKGKGDYKGTVEKQFTIRENNALHTFIAGGEWNLDYFDILEGGDSNIANISKIEALVEISSENTWGMIQVGEGKNLRKEWFNKGGEYLAVGTNGIYTFSWTPETSTAYEDIDYYYGQVLLGAGEAEAGKEIGKLLAYKVTFSNDTEEYVTGKMKRLFSEAPRRSDRRTRRQVPVPRRRNPRS